MGHIGALYSPREYSQPIRPLSQVQQLSTQIGTRRGGDRRDGRSLRVTVETLFRINHTSVYKENNQAKGDVIIYIPI